jgi:hypothetical protein
MALLASGTWFVFPQQEMERRAERGQDNYSPVPPYTSVTLVLFKWPSPSIPLLRPTVLVDPCCQHAPPTWLPSSVTQRVALGITPPLLRRASAECATCFLSCFPYLNKLPRWIWSLINFPGNQGTSKCILRQVGFFVCG